MARAKPLFSSRQLNLYLSLADVRGVLTLRDPEGRRRQRWLVKPTTNIFTSNTESQWVSSDMAAHVRLVVMVDSAIDRPGTPRFNALLKWLLAWKKGGILAHSQLYVLMYQRTKIAVCAGDKPSYDSLNWQDCLMSSDGNRWLRAPMPSCLNPKDFGDIEKVVCCADALLMAQFDSHNTLRAVVNSKGEVDDVYFERSFTSMQRRVERQIELDKLPALGQSACAPLPSVSKFFKLVKGEARLIDDRRKLLPPLPQKKRRSAAMQAAADTRPTLGCGMWARRRPVGRLKKLVVPAGACAIGQKI